jgi:hypothetical protein
MESGDDSRSWENSDEKTEEQNQGATRQGQEKLTQTREEQCRGWERDSAEEHVGWLAGQFRQAVAELLENWANPGGGERLGADWGKKDTTTEGKEGRERPPMEAGKLLQEEEKKEKKLEDC